MHSGEVLNGASSFGQLAIYPTTKKKTRLYGLHDTQHNAIQHNDNQLNDIQHNNK
jgi:hypothetical protein